jgi:hypothetical protein
MRVVISQSMYFPWVGFLEQLRLADVFVFYDDVQFSKGSFTNRVQVKTAGGSRWMTAPLPGLRLGQRIDEVLLDSQRDWRIQHRDMLRQAYQDAPYLNDMLALVDDVFARPLTTLSDLARASVLALAGYFGLTSKLRILDAAALEIGGSSSTRVLDIVRSLSGTTYITGHGARNYLDHAAFENAGIAVHYMQYRCVPYPQLHGAFTPYVSGLDLVANCGRDGAAVICSEAIDWKEFVK